MVGLPTFSVSLVRLHDCTRERFARATVLAAGLSWLTRRGSVTKRNERGGTYTERKKGESYLPTRPLALIG